VLYVETSFPDLGILDNKILIAAVLLAVWDWYFDYLVKYSFCDTEILNLRTDDLYFDFRILKVK
jgi:cell division transport system permease protein